MDFLRLRAVHVQKFKRFCSLARFSFKKGRLSQELGSRSRAQKWGFKV